MKLYIIIIITAVTLLSGTSLLDNQLLESSLGFFGPPGGLMHSVEKTVFKEILPNIWIRAHELCESRGGRPGLPSLISLRFL